MAYFFKKLAYGFLVLLGVVSAVFFIFAIAPGDPVENLVSENASAELKENIRKKLDLDLPLGERYVVYVNDISPLSLYDLSPDNARIQNKLKALNIYGSLRLGEHWQLVLKTPYLNRSYVSDRLVWNVISEAMPGTIVLACVAMFFAILLGMFLGVVAALNKDGWIDKLSLVLSVLGMSGPSFFMAILIAWIAAYLWYLEIAVPILPILFILGIWIYEVLKRYYRQDKSMAFPTQGLLIYSLGIFILWIMLLALAPPWMEVWLNQSYVYLPGTGLSMTGSLYDVDVWRGEFLNLRNLILPAITLGIRPLAVIVQLTRSSMLDVLGQDYIRTAKAKGLRKVQVLLRHALPNTLNPVLTAVSGWFASLLAGAVFVEFVFGYRGLGLAVFSALEKSDVPVVMGAVIVISITFVAINLLVDVLYGVIDPRASVQ